MYEQEANTAAHSSTGISLKTTFLALCSSNNLVTPSTRGHMQPTKLEYTISISLLKWEDSISKTQF